MRDFLKYHVAAALLCLVLVPLILVLGLDRVDRIVAAL